MLIGENSNIDEGFRDILNRHFKVRRRIEVKDESTGEHTIQVLTDKAKLWAEIQYDRLHGYSGYDEHNEDWL